MSPKEFVDKYKSFAIDAEKKTGILATVTLAQAALESGWGAKAPENNFFGIKSFGNPKQQLLTTFEFSKNGNLTPKQIGLINIISVTPSKSNPGLFLYKGQAWFRSFDTPAEAFEEHAQVFFKNRVYLEALAHRENAEKFVSLMAVHYAQSPTYSTTIMSLIKTISPYLYGEVEGAPV